MTSRVTPAELAVLDGLDARKLREMLQYLAGWSPGGFRDALTLARVPGRLAAVPDLAAAQASPANPYGSSLHWYRGSKGYGTPCVTCGQAPGAHEQNAAHAPDDGHLLQCQGGSHECTYLGCTTHDVAGMAR